ncbi:glycyl-radical enzyme activating protein [Pelosinus propionicus]|uniref:Pyruvate formate lyase activating enzyme n=1 Tax=Pelosinus propionicus DSM 13327 TaxID=1123291 RepID=A0A1I4H2A8_9FIRM|nr:glycyl-radical enzyme activating protein [Pelosinus propionicus]SFL35521.1 pyruvate formate lyase activating enzyme [Pelosinus propionicus DSM 13327]
MKDSNGIVGNVFQIQRWSVHDGDGVRSTVFLKGCPLRCKWCANPESWKPHPEIFYFRDRCTDCAQCSLVCNHQAISKDEGVPHYFDREKCCCCGDCCEACPNGAKKKIGSLMRVEEVIKILKRDSIFYRESNGGVTFSGGEPFAQTEFLRELVLACKNFAIDTAIETSGYFEWEEAEDIIKELDTVFIDIKHMDERIHKRLTGVSNRKILENVLRISQNHHDVIIRVPLIRGVNDDRNNIEQMCQFLQENTRILGVELLPYHSLGHSKMDALDREGLEIFNTPDAEQVEHIKKIIAKYKIQNIDFK